MWVARYNDDFEIIVVGYYAPDGTFHSIKNFDMSDEKTALAFVNYLNGGNGRAFN